MQNDSEQNEPEIQEFADGTLRLTVSPIAILEFCQPGKRNAVTMQMWAELPTVLQAIAANEKIRVLLIRGSGTEAFCAGADITEFREMYSTPESTNRYINAVRQAQYDLRHLPHSTIAWIYGDCVGSGCGLALACDLRFAADNARFGIPPARLGLAYSVEDTAQLVEKVGPAFAKDLLFSARLIDSREALAAGLIDRSFAAAELEAAVTRYAASMTELPRASIQASKTTINAITDSQIPDNAELRDMYQATFSGEDMKEGYEAFLSRRKPIFWKRNNE